MVTVPLLKLIAIVPMFRSSRFEHELTWDSALTPPDVTGALNFILNDMLDHVTSNFCELPSEGNVTGNSV